MRTTLQLIAVVTVGLPLPTFAQAEKLVLGKNLDNRNSCPGENKGDAVEMWGDCSVGFNIPKEYRGKRVKITARVVITAGRAKCGIDKYGLCFQHETDWFGPGPERDIVLECRCPGGDDLFAVVHPDHASRVLVKFIKIEIE